jgi:hypothetical protein
MAAPARTPRGKSRPWIALFTSLLNDTDLVLAGQDARGLFPYLLLHSAEQGLKGHVPSDPRAVQLFAHLDGGVPAVSAALDSLVGIGKLVRDGDRLYIRTWDRYQADFGGSATRAASSTASALKRWHNEGKHIRAADGCELCETGAPGAAERKGSDASAVQSKVWERCEQVAGAAAQSGEDMLAAYTELYAFVAGQAPRFSDVKGVGEAALLDIVVDHAANHYLGGGKPLADDTLEDVHGIRGRHGVEVLEKLAQAADKKKPTGYFFACYRDDVEVGVR